ncbi:MAG: biotin--[Paludibacteraceae bacterium]|nr:biotin--[acetyl-CoA-carboxylase] ligase [Paludibacteraceae bacterium]
MRVETTDSTNTLLKELIANGQQPKFLYAGYQTAGRGQTGNGWESEANKNLLCSILLPARENLFELNVVTAVAVQRLLGEDFTIKWPNDIYWQDRKIAGILIENAIIGNELKYSIAGIGLNVNQTEWHSGAPNPVSLKQITGKDYDIDELMEHLYAEVQKALNEDVWSYYKAHLYRREGFWPFVEREVSTAPTMNANSQEPIANSQFLARIKDILPTGEIVLADQQGKERIYHFKQIRYVL